MDPLVEARRQREDEHEKRCNRQYDEHNKSHCKHRPDEILQQFHSRYPFVAGLADWPVSRLIPVYRWIVP